MRTYAMHAKAGCGGWDDPHDLRAVLGVVMSAAGGRGRHRHGRHSHEAMGGESLGHQFGGPGWGGGSRRGRRARRGDIRSAALLLLSEQPRNGYQIMQEVEERSGGLWSPSPGSVYPALQQLEDEGLIRAEEIDGRKLFALTDSGREQVEQRDPERSAPWEEVGGGELGSLRMQLGQAMRAVATAAVQVIRTGSDAQMTQAQKVLDTAKRDLYRVLAEDGEEV